MENRKHSLKAEEISEEDPPSTEETPAPRHGLRFDEVVAEYERKIFNMIFRVLGDYDEAADLTQETFISAYRAWGRFRGESGVYTWLYQIALNHCRNKLRQRGRVRAISVESLDQALTAESEGTTRDVPDETYAPHTLLQEKELNQKILAAVQSLPPDYREVVVLRELNGLSYNEIVEATGVSLDNVKTRLSRARAMLRRKLEHYYRG